MNYDKKLTNASVAWYKLADLITRKEREKALNVYRLLSHSFEDRAYALQLEGDILKSLDDQSASKKYQQAAFLYKKEKRWIDAIAVCEHLLYLEPDNFELLATLIDLYALIDWQEKCSERLTKAYELLEKKVIGEDQVFEVIKMIVAYADDTELQEEKRWIIPILRKQQKMMPDSLKLRVKKLRDLWGPGFFKVNACDYCDDITSELADISCGDAWFHPYTSDWRGSNVVITRSTLAQQLVDKGIEKNILKLDLISSKKILR